MSRKHNTKHMSRGMSNYGQRLADRGLTRTPEMRDFGIDIRKKPRRDQDAKK